MMKCRLSTSVLVVLALFSCSCSFIYVKPPDEQYSPKSARMPPDCSDSKAAPISDMAMVGIGTLNMLSGLPGLVDDFEGNDTAAAVSVGAGAAWTLLFGVSAATGFSKVNKCGEFERSYQAHLRRDLDRQHPSLVDRPAPTPDQAGEGADSQQTPEDTATASGDETTGQAESSSDSGESRNEKAKLRPSGKTEGITVEEAAEGCKLYPEEFHARIDAGELGVFEAGGTAYLSKEAVDALCTEYFDPDAPPPRAPKLDQIPLNSQFSPESVDRETLVWLLRANTGDTVTIETKGGRFLEGQIGYTSNKLLTLRYEADDGVDRDDIPFADIGSLRLNWKSKPDGRSPRLAADAAKFNPKKYDSASVRSRLEKASGQKITIETKSGAIFQGVVDSASASSVTISTESGDADSTVTKDYETIKLIRLSDG